MKTRKKTILGVLAISALVGAGVVAAQHQAAAQPAQHQQAEHQEHELEIFCSHLSAGQLCLGGTPNVLKLDGTKKEQWLAAAREYNKSVDASTKQLLAQAKMILSPQDYATVQKWFDHGLNEVLNTVLIGNQAKTSHR